MDSLNALKEATKNLPQAKYAWGLIALSIAAAFAINLLGSSRAALIAVSLAGIGFVVVGLSCIGLEKQKISRAPASVIIWCITITFALFLAFTVSAFSISKPCNWVRFLKIATSDCKSKEETEKYLGEAEYYLLSRNFSMASDFYQKAINVSPNNYRGYLGLARTTFYQGRFYESRSNYEKVLKFMGDDYRPLYGIAMTLDATGQYREALDYTERALDAIISEKLHKNESIKTSIIYDLGLLNLILWIETDNESFYQASKKNFSWVLERAPDDRWSLYGMACLEAHRSVSAPRSTALAVKQKALSYLESARNLLDSYQSEKGDYQNDLFDTLMSYESWAMEKRKAGEPIRCEALVDLSARQKQ
ncbi:tetratricopeptide repeat protein [Marinobacter sp. OP 3.4]|uniref:tetratricopeptide repeat protein n=1 Tax=Marinobacter sp. OP 3.4 TaxID=3076501 RepID=UPI002E207BA1